MQLGAAKRSVEAKLSTTRTASQPVDLVHLTRYTLGDRALERETLTLFSNQTGVYLDRLREAAGEKEWREAAHSLKGSARAVGAWQLAAAAEAAEAIGEAEGRSHWADYIIEVEACVKATTAYIEVLLSER